MSHVKRSFQGDVTEDGRLVLRDEYSMRQFIRQHKGKPMLVTLEQMRNKRSNQQLRFLFGVAYPILEEHTGYTKDELHEIFKLEFNPVIKTLTNKVTNETRDIVIGGSTEDMSTVDFMEFYRKIQQEGASLGCYLPDPNEDWSDR